jgi:hypothetical protein
MNPKKGALAGHVSISTLMIDYFSVEASERKEGSKGEETRVSLCSSAIDVIVIACCCFTAIDQYKDRY